MRKVIAFALAILLIAGIATQVSAVDYGTVIIKGQGNQPSSGFRAGHGQGILAGQGKYDSAPHRTFRFVRYAPAPSTTAIVKDYIVSKDSVVIWATHVSGDDGITVTLTDTSQDTRIAGILATDALPPISTDVISGADADVGKRNWAYLQTYGLANAFYSAGGGSSVAGAAFGTSTISGEIGLFNVSVTEDFHSAIAGNTQLGMGGFFYDAESAGARGVAVFLRCE